jgi:hypothetical protein
MQTFNAAWLIVVSLTLSGADAKPPTDPLSEIIAHNTRARGGAEAIEGARTVQLRMRIVEPTFAVDAVYKASRDGKMRIDVSANGKRVYSEGYDGRHGWQWPAEAAHASDASPAGQAALRHGLEYPTSLRGLYETRPRGHALTYAGRESLDGTSYHVLKLTLKDGFTTYLYVNPHTYLIDRQRDQRAIHPDADASVKWLEQRFSDYRRADGRIISFKSEQVDLRTKQVRQTTTVVDVTTNPHFEPLVFERP